MGEKIHNCCEYIVTSLRSEILNKFKITIDMLRNNFQSIVILNLFKISERSEVTIYSQQL